MNVQQFQSDRGCLSYIVSANGEAVLIDPTEEIQDDVYLDYLSENGLTLRFLAETHTHADHITSNLSLKEKTGAQIAMHALSPSKRKDIVLEDGYTLPIGGKDILVRYTPGHTNEHVIYIADDKVFTGDTLLINGTGRTDFQLGDSASLYESLWNIIIPLGDEVTVYPGHDYSGNNKTTIADSKEHNARLQLDREAFIELMNAHHPDLPELFDESIEKNSQ